MKSIGFFPTDSSKFQGDSLMRTQTETFGSGMVMAGVDLPTLKELMGHSTITTTMRYVHPTPEHKRAAVDKLERFNVEQVFQCASDNRGPHKSLHSHHPVT